MIDVLVFFAVTLSLYAWGRKIDRDQERDAQRLRQAAGK